MHSCPLALFLDLMHARIISLENMQYRLPFGKILQVFPTERILKATRRI